MKNCIKCGKRKRLKSFLKDKGSCKACRAKYHLIWHHKNKKRRNAQIKEYKNVSRKRILDFVLKYLKEHPCADCGETDHMVLEFDHVRGEKKYNISKMVGGCMNINLIIAEIEKCDVRCANCHRRKTAKQFNWLKNGR